MKKFLVFQKKFAERTIMNAIKEGNLNRVKFFIEVLKVPINEVYYAHWSAIHYAIHRNSLEIVKYLIKKNCEKEIIDSTNKWTPLHRSIRTLNFEMVKFLVESGCQVNQKILLAAIYYYEENIFKFLLQYITDDGVKNYAIEYSINFNEKPYSTELYSEIIPAIIRESMAI